MSVPAAMPDGSPWPRISIVTPSFNQGHFVEETIRSVLLQGYPELEYFVLDGGSTDGSVEVIRRYEPWLAGWVSEKDRGQSHAINKGLARSTGEIFSYLNSDDLLVPGALARLAPAFHGDPAADAIYGHCVYIDEESRELLVRRPAFSGYAEYLRIWSLLAEGRSLTQPEVFCRRRVFEEVGGFREDLDFVMDLEMWLRMLSEGCRFRALDAPVAMFRMYGSQKSARGGLELSSLVAEHLGRDDDVLPPQLRRSLRRELRVARANWLVHDAGLREYPGAALDCLAAALGRPALLRSWPFWAVLSYPVRGWFPRSLRRSIRGGLTELADG